MRHIVTVGFCTLLLLAIAAYGQSGGQSPSKEAVATHDTGSQTSQWLWDNKEWVFSGIGVSIIIGLVAVAKKLLQSPAATGDISHQSEQRVSQHNNQVVNVHVHAGEHGSASEGDSEPKVQDPVISTAPGSITGEALKLLRLLAERSGGGGLGSGELTKALRIPHMKVEHHLDQLVAEGLVSRTVYIQRSSVYQLTPKGRAYLVRSGEF